MRSEEKEKNGKKVYAIKEHGDLW